MTQDLKMQFDGHCFMNASGIKVNFISFTRDNDAVLVVKGYGLKCIALAHRANSIYCAL